MAVFNQIIRPLNWLHTLNLRRSTYAQTATPETVVNTASNVPVPSAQHVRWVGNVIRLPRRLDASCYQELLSVVQQLYPSGNELVLDVRDVERLDLSGIFALHCTVSILRGETPPEPEQGWRALRIVTEQNLAAGRQEKLKAINPSTRIDALMRANHLDRCLVIQATHDAPSGGL